MLQVLAARAASLDSSGKVRTIIGSAEELDMLETDSVDVVTCFDTFHWLNRYDAVREFSRVLRPRGLLALAWNDLSLLESVNSTYRVPKPNDKWRGTFTAEGHFKTIAGCPQPERIGHTFHCSRDDLVSLCRTYRFGDMRPRPWTEEGMKLSGDGGSAGGSDGCNSKGGGSDSDAKLSAHDPAAVLARAILSHHQQLQAVRSDGGGSGGCDGGGDGGRGGEPMVALEYQTKLYLAQPRLGGRVPRRVRERLARLAQNDLT